MANFGFCPNKQSQSEYVSWKEYEKIEYSSCKASCGCSPESLVCLAHWRRDPKQGIWVGLYCKEFRIYGRELSGLYGPRDAYQFPGERKTKREAFKTWKKPHDFRLPGW